MEAREEKQVVVVGAGIMGRGIAPFGGQVGGISRQLIVNAGAYGPMYVGQRYME